MLVYGKSCDRSRSFDDALPCFLKNFKSDIVHVRRRMRLNYTCTSGADPGIWKGGGGGGGGGGTVRGAAPGRVREGGTPPAQLGGMGERCKLPHRVVGRRPRIQRILRLKSSENYAKKQAC